MLEEGHRAWPDIELQPEQIKAYLDSRAPSAESGAPHAADLFLACACLCGNEPALRHFEAICRSELGFALKRLRIPVDQDDIIASLLAKSWWRSPEPSPSCLYTMGIPSCGDGSRSRWRATS
jgi:hypothetical protein